MKIDENLVAVHAYLCADGYVIKNPKENKNKYYIIGFRNTNLELLEDFQIRFYRYFRLKPYLIKGERCRMGSKDIFKKLTNKFGSFYSNEWKMPKLNKRLSKFWLRAFFDCEGWVFCKVHQNRHIGLDSVNEEGLDQIRFSLDNLNIKTIKKINKKRGIHRIFIYGRSNLIKFEEEIGFLHPEKKDKLSKAIADYVDYFWKFPRQEKELKKYVKEIVKEKTRIKKPYIVRIISKEEINLSKLRGYLKKYYNINSLLYKRINGIGTTYYELSINRKLEVEKLVNLGIIPNIFKESCIN